MMMMMMMRTVILNWVFFLLMVLFCGGDVSVSSTSSWCCLFPLFFEFRLFAVGWGASLFMKPVLKYLQWFPLFVQGQHGGQRSSIIQSSSKSNTTKQWSCSSHHLTLTSCASFDHNTHLDYPSIRGSTWLEPNFAICAAWLAASSSLRAW